MESYADDPLIEEKTLKLIEGYVKKYYYSFKTLIAHGIPQEDVISDTCLYMYKTNKNGEDFLDKMSKIKTEKHYRAFIKRSVMNTFYTLKRKWEKEPIVASLDYTGESLKDYTDECLGESLIDRIPDPNAFVEDKVMESIALNAINNEEYDDLVFYLDENNIKPLETKDIVAWIVGGRTIKALTESVYRKSTKEQVEQKYLKNEVERITNELRKELEKVYEIRRK